MNHLNEIVYKFIGHSREYGMDEQLSPRKTAVATFINMV